MAGFDPGDTKDCCVTLTVEGDLWDYSAVAETASGIGEEFLKRFYVQEGDSSTAEMLAEFDETVRNPHTLGCYHMRTRRMHAELAFENSWHLLGEEHESDFNLRYNDDEGGLVSMLTGKKYPPPVKIFNYPRLILQTVPYHIKGPLEPTEGKLERFMRALSDDSLIIDVTDGRKKPYVTAESLKKALKPEHWDAIPSIVAGQRNAPRYYCYVLFKKDRFWLGRGNVSIEISKLSSLPPEEDEEA